MLFPLTWGSTYDDEVQLSGSKVLKGTGGRTCPVSLGIEGTMEGFLTLTGKGSFQGLLGGRVGVKAKAKGRSKPQEHRWVGDVGDGVRRVRRRRPRGPQVER